MNLTSAGPGADGRHEHREGAPQLAVPVPPAVRSGTVKVRGNRYFRVDQGVDEAPGLDLDLLLQPADPGAAGRVQRAAGSVTGRDEKLDAGELLGQIGGVVLVPVVDGGWHTSGRRRTDRRVAP